jgi:hypothetical protein
VKYSLPIPILLSKSRKLKVQLSEVAGCKFKSVNLKFICTLSRNYKWLCSALGKSIAPLMNRPYFFIFIHFLCVRLSVELGPSKMKYIELQKQRHDVSPSLVLSDLATKCETLGISKSDVYGDFSESSDTSYLRQFEEDVTKFIGKEDAIFVPSGVMAQNIVLVSCRPKDGPFTFVCHHSSHLLIHEKDAYSKLLNAQPLIIQPEKSTVQRPINYHDVIKYLDADIKPSLMIIEVPHREIGGKCTSWDDLVQISTHCRRVGVHLHMDGARLYIYIYIYIYICIYMY